MRLRAMPVALAAALATLVGCAAPAPVACTMIAAQSGMSVTVDASVASRLDDLRLRICWADRCVTRPVDLVPGSNPVPGTCSGTDPDDTCSATSSPNGTLVGFAEVEDLPAGPVRIGGTALLNARSQRYAAVEVIAETVYPNGPDCPGSGVQAAVVVGAGGLR